MIKDNEIVFVKEIDEEGKEIMNKKETIRPEYYNKGIECVKYIQSWDLNFCAGNVIKYVTRYQHKHESSKKQLEDLIKARTYLNLLIEDLDTNPK